MKKCYMCDAEATTKEHVPPLCLFPERKDMQGRDFRVNLTKVPSCKEHNNKYSKDDEFLMVCLAGMIGNNSIGYEHQSGKINRAIKRRSMKLLDSVCSNRKNITIELSNNKFKEIILSTPDVPRIKRVMEKISYGIHYKHFKKRFHGKVRVFPTFLSSNNSNFNNFKNMIRDKTDIELTDKEEIGNNSSVFTYQFTEPDMNGIYGLRMKFYEGIEVHVGFAPEHSVAKKDFVSLCIDGGIETNIHVGNKVYSFNKPKIL